MSTLAVDHHIDHSIFLVEWLCQEIFCTILSICAYIPSICFSSLLVRVHVSLSWNKINSTVAIMSLILMLLCRDDFQMSDNFWHDFEARAFLTLIIFYMLFIYTPRYLVIDKLNKYMSLSWIYLTSAWIGPSMFIIFEKISVCSVFESWLLHKSILY